jgi:transglutaminase-like putative cysteine protease
LNNTQIYLSLYNINNFIVRITICVHKKELYLQKDFRQIATMKLRVACQLKYESQENVPLVLVLRPQSGAGQQVLEEQFLISPNITFTEYRDIYGNLCQRIFSPIGKLSITSTALVETSDTIDVDFSANFIPVENLPEQLLIYLLPSRYCESDRFSYMAAEITQYFNLGYAQVEGIRQWVRNNVEYQYGYSSSSSSACDINQSRIGVCRDFSHLCIALCRAINIPARMVVGYLYDLKPMDLHAWFEVYLDNQWFTFDATQQFAKGNRVVLAYGRDASDVAFATQFGNIQLLDMQVSVYAS